MSLPEPFNENVDFSLVKIEKKVNALFSLDFTSKDIWEGFHLFAKEDESFRKDWFKMQRLYNIFSYEDFNTWCVIQLADSLTFAWREEDIKPKEGNDGE